MPLKEVSPFVGVSVCRSNYALSCMLPRLAVSAVSRLLYVWFYVYMHICIKMQCKALSVKRSGGVRCSPHIFAAFRNEIQLFFMGFLPCYMPCFASASIRLLLLFARNAYLIFSFIGVNGTLSPPRLGVPPLEVPNALPTPHLVG